MKKKGGLRVLPLLVVCIFAFPINSFGAEKMWPGLAPVVNKDGSIKFVDKPIPYSMVPFGVPEGAKGYWGFKHEQIGFNRAPIIDTSKWTARDWVFEVMRQTGMDTPPLKDLINDQSFVLIDKKGTERWRDFTQYRKPYYGKDGIRYKNLVYMNAPADIRGLSLLVIKHMDVNKADDQWIYLPALRKVRRISAAQKMDSFAGTDLPNDEFDRNVDVDWTWEFLKEEIGDPAKPPFRDVYGKDLVGKWVKGRPLVWVKGTAKHKDWPINTIRACFDKEKVVQYYLEYLDKAGKTAITLVGSFYPDAPQNPLYRSYADWLVEDVRTGHKTWITADKGREPDKVYHNLISRDWSNKLYWYDTGYSDEFFTTRYMERGTR